MLQKNIGCGAVESESEGILGGVRVSVDKNVPTPTLTLM
jgi:hypothetical protein